MTQKSHQKLIAGGKLLQDEQVVSSLALGTSNIIHLVISEQTKEPKEAPQPEIVPSGPSVSVQEETEPTEEINEENSENSESRNLENAQLENEQTTVNTSGENTAAQTQQSSTESTKEEESWLTPELKRYFDVWDLSIRCYEINGSYDHLVPQLKLYRNLIFEKEKAQAKGQTLKSFTEIITRPILAEQPPQEELPRQNPERENAVVGAQGAVEDDGPQDWLDRFYSFFRVCLMLCLVYSYSSTERFVTVLVISLSIILYQAGVFNIRRRARPAPAQNDTDQNDQEPRDGAQAQEPPQRGIFTMLWVFLSSFFTSLIPQNPAVVDAN
ncbi:Oidioi.mRNA.OKI2018_I69.chr2.g7870.t1.cds [Oikopleura dioica]|uniref:Oidioi.mRNA.OKI2018_I69.chr2.g7870.t1.cds n=1 Tax=Oikopleura dioica TaxID=34765 RepID=A0ABN7TE08_OIKDI|nr:Oidioi.mRNA.OKI2018_I69.chr2.g7870.t1.cds [Oikopleura dioica]